MARGGNEVAKLSLFFDIIAWLSPYIDLDMPLVERTMISSSAF